MKKLKIFIATLALAGVGFTVQSASALSVDCGDLSETECQRLVQQIECQTKKDQDCPTDRIIEPRDVVTINENDHKLDIAPTFRVDTNGDKQLVELWAGKNLLLAGNHINSNQDVKSGLLLSAGNSLSLSAHSEYGFLFGNTIDFKGTTSRDLYIAGNLVEIAADAQIGRDLFVTSSELTVLSDLNGDLSAAVDSITLRDVKIAGNVNLTSEYINFEGNVEIAGALTYNDNAEVSGLDQVKYGSVEAYHVDEVHPAAIIVAKIYSKVVSIVGLFLIMAIICAVYKDLHQKIDAEANVSRFGMNLAVGICALVFIPVIALLAFFTYIAAPLGIVALLLYGLLLYLSQGFAGLWIGHLIVEKWFKSKSNIYLEALLGIVLLGFLSLIPYLGIATGFLGLVLGLGLIVACVKPGQKADTAVGKKD